VVAIARSAKDAGAAEPAPVRTPVRWKTMLAGLVLTHCLAAVYIERTTPGTEIDCYTFQRDALKTLMRGQDPYGTTQANIYPPDEARMFYGPGMVVDGRVQVGFQYPPLTLLWAAPGYLLGDVRYSYVLAVVLSAVLCFAIYPNRWGFFLAAFLLWNPVGLFVESRCWTEPLVLLGLCATLYAATRKSWWLPIAAGLFLASKQYNLMAVPFLGFLVVPFRWRDYWGLVGRAAAVAAATFAPFVLWNPRAMWHDLVLFHLAQPFRADALSFAVLSRVALKVGPVLVVGFIAWSVRAGAKREAMFATGYGSCLLVLFCTSKQAFSNYYFLIGMVLLLAAVGFRSVGSNARAEEAA
jgi:hypothetical protein